MADRIQSGSGDYPALVRAAAELPDDPRDERERAVDASRMVIGPLAARGTDGGR